VKRLRSIVSLLLLALWLPATLHCDLEAAGLDHVLGCHEHATDEAAHCHDDVWHAIDVLASKADNSGLRIVLPTLMPHYDCMAFGVAPATPLAPVNVSPPIRPPPDLDVGWPFVRRAAPPARAPAL
jgi:hypothetical protein